MTHSAAWLALGAPDLLVPEVMALQRALGATTRSSLPAYFNARLENSSASCMRVLLLLLLLLLLLRADHDWEEPSQERIRWLPGWLQVRLLQLQKGTES